MSSCCSAKQLTENTTKEQPKESVEAEMEVIIETEPVAEVIEAPISIETSTEVEESENVVIPEPIVAIPEAFNHEAWNIILKTNVSNAGNVNYNAIKDNRKKLTSYITSLGDNMPNETWTKADKLAYWINAYNAMTVDLIVKNYPLKSIKDIKDPWEQRLWKLNDKWYNLDEIEHQILRKMDEPRIHFAIVCASFSCPKLQNEAFIASKIETQLTTATRGFLSDSKRNSITQDNIKLSKIFKWFSKDFEQNGTLIDFLNKYSDVTIIEKAKKSYLDYNWDLNN
jgi:hypothetical protein